MNDFSKRRTHLAHLSDEELKEYFFKLLEEITEPILSMAKKYTSPSLERSILLRMGFSSLEAQAIVTHALREDLLGHGAGHLVLKYAELNNLPLRDAGLKLASDEGWAELKTFWSRQVKANQEGV
ncbi:MAG: D-ornithine 4,5-aminomutase subunit alpha [candidate division WS2 bacterium]|nr:D-ornithine 4,5-aminomutase subunit alpha [Candidatus Lithacetigena glycinireducens]MBT9174980.1 D-ornithine 4,5-aminomutase subunit alpha [Candidatus Lithacetigena glycinireducens]